MSDHMRIPAARDFPSGRLQLWKEHLVSEVALQHTTTPRRRRRVFLLVPAVAVLLAASGFTTYALTREPTQLESIGCFAQSDLNSNTAIVNADGRDPVAICADVWRTGGFVGTPTPHRLTACVLESGAIGVFPRSGPDTCGRLGLAPLPASYAEEVKRFAALREAVVAELGAPATGSSQGSPKCIGEQTARKAVRRALDTHGYRDWGIEVAAATAFSAERPCAEAAFDGGRKVVTLMPVWR